MKKYEFSVPMPYHKEQIDELLKINANVEKSEITNLYFNLPPACDMATIFEQQRNYINDKTDFEYWKDLISYSLECGFDFIYLLNSPRRLEIEKPDFMKEIEKLQRLLAELKKLGVNKLRVSNPKLLTYLSIENKDFDLYASTSFEYRTIKEYQNFLLLHPTVKQIVLSSDTIKNFRLLKNLKESLTNVDIELMVNEGCMGGCPHKHEHLNEYTDAVFFYTNTNIALSSTYCSSICRKLMDKNLILQICKANVIYPWEVKEYGELGFNKFKLVGRDSIEFSKGKYFENYYNYLKGIDNIKNILDTTILQYIHHLKNHTDIFNYTVKDLYKYIPDIKHFKKSGHLCQSDCGVKCTYCYNCADKIKEFVSKNTKSQLLYKL